LHIGIVRTGDVGERGGRLATTEGLTIVVVAEREYIIGGEVFLTNVTERVAERNLVHTAVLGVNRAVDSDGDKLKVVGRIEEYTSSVNIVAGIVIDDASGHLEDNNNMLGVDNA
jgi:hypothetical protein